MLGFWRIATRETLGATSLSSSNCFPTTSGAMLASPVMLLPGRARLATRPAATGSPETVKTMGIVLVACLAASVGGGDAVTMTSTFMRTSSAASPGSRSYCPSADRYSIAMF